MSSRILRQASEISTHFRCDNCGILLNKVTCKRCDVCQAFELCEECGAKPYNQLRRVTLANHEKYHVDNQFTPVKIDDKNLKDMSILDAPKSQEQARLELRKQKCERILHDKKIENDYEMAMVVEQLSSGSQAIDDNVKTMIVDYYLKANKRDIHVLSLDGGGVRGYMPIRILEELIANQNNFKVEDLDLKNLDDKKFFLDKQKKFTENFDYFVGTSTGGLIAFCLAVNYNIMDMKKIYSDSKTYFKKNWLGPVFYSKYDPSLIHNQIDEIIDQLKFPGKTFVSRASEHATLLDLRNLLNPDRIIHEDEIEAAMTTHGNLLEFVDENKSKSNRRIVDESSHSRVPREKVLLITSYNTTGNTIIIFNTSYAGHWGYRIADVLKATMAAPTYFPPQKIYRGIQTGGRFTPQGNPELFVDGGIFANDPEVAALWALRMQWKKTMNYILLCVGTGCYTSTLSPRTWGGYCGWIFNGGFLVNTLMDATRSFTEIIGSNLAKFNNMRRMKLNYKITSAMALDDPNFVHVFDQEWESDLKNGNDFNAFVQFYEKYILKK